MITFLKNIDRICSDPDKQLGHSSEISSVAERDVEALINVYAVTRRSYRFPW